jgi:FkbM family methyltransferase
VTTSKGRPDEGSSMSQGDLASALSQLGRHANLRDLLIASLRDAEAIFPDKSVNVREVITGPIVDALFEKDELLEKEIEGGLRYKFRYTSKIARDFVLATSTDHVWEPQTTKLLVRLGQHAKTAVIGGAYFGDQAVLLAHAMRRIQGTCYCFEPNRQLFELLETNVRLNDLRNLVAIQRGLWNRNEVDLSFVGQDSHASSREGRDTEERTFKSASVDSFAHERNIAVIDILMLDIEGAELAALMGAARFLEQTASTAPSIVFEIHGSYMDWSNGLESTEIARYLEEFGYFLYAIRDYQGNVDMRGRPIELVPIRTAYIEGPPHGFNVLAIKNTEVLGWLDARLVDNVSPKLLFHRDPKLHQPLY